MSGKIRKNTGYFIGWKKKYSLSVFDHFVGLALKGILDSS